MILKILCNGIFRDEDLIIHERMRIAGKDNRIRVDADDLVFTLLKGLQYISVGIQRLHIQAAISKAHLTQRILIVREIKLQRKMVSRPEIILLRKFLRNQTHLRAAFIF